jgi:hypothetical protein
LDSSFSVVVDVVVVPEKQIWNSFYDYGSAVVLVVVAASLVVPPLLTASSCDDVNYSYVDAAATTTTLGVPSTSSFREEDDLVHIQ